MSLRTFIFLFDGSGEEKTITIDINKTVKDLLDNNLNRKNLSNSPNDFAFMVGANSLKSSKNINSQIKNVKFLRPNVIIKVREVDTKAGGRL